MATPIRVQLTAPSPGDFQLTDADLFAGFAPDKIDPTGRALSVDDKYGYIHNIEVQGMRITADKYHVKRLVAGVVYVLAQSDDPRYNPPGKRVCHELIFRSIGPMADPKWNGCINTRITHNIYCEPEALAAKHRSDTKPWNERPIPLFWRYGAELPDELAAQHWQRQVRHGWRHPTWNRHLDSSEYDRNGFIKPQRPQGRYVIPDGTITYYLRDTARATGVHTATHLENALELTAGTGQTDAIVVANDFDGLSSIWTTPANEPNSADWPNGDYRVQFDLAVWDSKLTGDLVNPPGHFGQVNGGLTSDNLVASGGASITGAGITLITLTGWNPAAGNASDRFEIALAIANSSSHGGTEDATFTYDADAFADGPWTAAAPSPINTQQELLGVGD